MTNPFPVGRLRPPPDAPVDAARLRAVHRAVSELRRGTPVLLAGAEPLALLPVETVSARGVAELAALAVEPPVMLLAPARAAAVLRRRMSQRIQAVAIQVADCLADAEKLRGLADPTMEQPIRKLPVEAKLPVLARPALALAKLARLLPAMLAARARPDAAAEAARLGLLTVSAADVLAYPSGAAASLRRVAEAQVPTEQAADARVVAFRTEDGA
ncbi:MAG TPA: GTP cyclohydrolase II, partial [Acetobacteraceae bacterium]|nr:GTP cyclohydrolase II [Acetobacteraceae bacterium]